MESRDGKVHLTGTLPWWYKSRHPLPQQPKKQSSANEEGFDKILEHERLRIREDLENMG